MEVFTSMTDIDTENYSAEVWVQRGDEQFRSPVMWEMRIITSTPTMLPLLMRCCVELKPREAGFLLKKTD